LATLTLTTATDAPCPRIAVTITGLTTGTDNTVTLWRTADGERNPVRGTKGLTVNGSTAVTDYEAPLGRTVSYDLEVTAGPDTGSTTPTATATLTPPTDVGGRPTWWVQDPLVPGSAIPLAVSRGDSSIPYLTAAAVKSLEYDSSVSIIPVLGTDKPVAIGGQRLAAAGVDFSLFTNTAQATTDLRDLLQQAAVLLVRPPNTGREGGVPGLFYTAVPKAVEQPVTVAFGGTLTKWQLTGATVAAPTAAILVPVWTYGAVAGVWADYQSAQTAYSGNAATYLDVLKNPTGT
jgi:hypothetical protein